MKSAANERCLALFPEMRERFSDKELSDTDNIGTYILHEDLFMHFVAAHQSNELMMRRVAAYVEELATSDQDQIRLAEIGLLESAVSNKMLGLAPYLGAAGRQLVVERVLTRFNVDPTPWKRRRQ